MCTMIRHNVSRSYSSLDWVLSRSVHFTVHRFICVYLCVFCVFVLCCTILQYCEHGWVDLMELKPNPYDQASFSALTLLVVPDMTYNVLSKAAFF